MTGTRLRSKRGRTKRGRVKRGRTKRGRTKRGRGMRGGGGVDEIHAIFPVKAIEEGGNMGIGFKQTREIKDYGERMSEMDWWPQVGSIDPTGLVAEYPEVGIGSVLLKINEDIAPKTYAEGEVMIIDAFDAKSSLTLVFSQPQDYTHEQRAMIDPTKQITIQTNPSGAKYCVFNDQLYYIGLGIYGKASNRTKQFYWNIFLPFYGFANEENQTGTLYKSNLQRETRSSTPVYGEGDNTIHLVFTTLIAEDGVREKAGEDMIYMNKSDGGRDGYTLVVDGSGKYPMMEAPSTTAIMNDLSRIFGIESTANIKELLISYLKHILGHFSHVGQDVGLSRIEHPYDYSPRDIIPKIQDKEMKMNRMGAIMVWLGRYSTDNNYQQLQDSIDLTYSLMVRYPLKNFSYRTEFYWIDYMRAANPYIDFDFE